MLFSLLVFLLLPALVVTYNTPKKTETKKVNATKPKCEEVKYTDGYDSLDSFFNDRIAMIVDPKGRFRTPGIFIDFHLILTSYIPFRELRLANTPLNSFKVCIFKGRDGYGYFYASTHRMICARQIIPYPEEELLKWKHSHGHNMSIRPRHDLMIVRTNPREYAIRSGFSWIYWDYIGFKFPSPVHVAKQHYMLKDNYLTIASLGFTSYDLMRDSDTLLSRSYFAEYAVTDCDEWLPRWWGHYICLNNLDNLKGVGSGAFLVHQNTLYGIGSFMLTKGNYSILVFTDVRKYYRMLGTACHEFEATNIKRTQAYDRDDFFYYSHHKRIKPFYQLFSYA
ncbi:uncharacterized protein LOC114349849 [Ostrinia furnacalis]|uniref:uncharacterized protein LOC114349849 n=1 Tax=Ostrinia furnacalis TaxID=93504 RepID=UPI001040CAFF|nr:uncharacterized protein LOC114349849 [Ostrinia furnacalis]